ncbi:MAG: rubrerythrin family protein [Firmicutes bacterium]|nr:rubrerythrin family protein [Bacillota bacterium]
MDRTEENLWKAFAGESQARNKYNYFAKVAKKEGYEQIAAVFEETAENEKEHAKRAFKFLKALGDTRANLKTAIEGENYEHTSMYPEFEKVAREEGYLEIADFFKEVAKVEAEHEKRYKALLNNLESGTVFKKTSKVRWKCRNCGYIYEGMEAPLTCPACDHPQAYYELFCENY